MERKEFEEVVIKTLESLPEKFKDRLKNIDILVEEDATTHLENENQHYKKITLGLYQGLPITKRAGKRKFFPDKITIYKKSLESVSRSKKELEKNIKRVVLHEIGHYFGLDDKKLRDLGY